MNLVKRFKPQFSTFFFVLAFLTIFAPGNVFAVDCKIISKDLNDSYNSYERKGGLWTLLEKTEALKTKSMIGMQADSKLRRAVTIYEDRCEAEPKNSNVEMARKISDLIDEGRMITNNNPETSPAKKIMQSVEGLLAHANKLLAEIDR